MRNPPVVHNIVRRVQRAHRITANPYVRTGLRLEDSLVYRDEVRYELESLIAPVRRAVLLMAEGHTISQAASQCGVSIRTIERSLAANV